MDARIFRFVIGLTCLSLHLVLAEDARNVDTNEIQDSQEFLILTVASAETDGFKRKKERTNEAHKIFCVHIVLIQKTSSTPPIWMKSGSEHF